MEEPAQDPDLLVPASATQLLESVAAGSSQAESALFSMLQGELRRIASRQMNACSPGHTLQTTALIHEAWVRLVGSKMTGPGGPSYNDRGHFLAVAARAMRQILTDHARRKQSIKRGGDQKRLPLDTVLEAYEATGHDLPRLDDALSVLAERRERLARVVELRFFAGLTLQETAESLGISTATVEREWRIARMWLLDQMGAA